MKVVFVGSNPSSKNVSKDVPFVGTKSHEVLLRWIGQLGIKDPVMLNVFNEFTVSNKSLTISQIKSGLPSLKTLLSTEYKDHHVVALGRSAEIALKLLKIDHFKLPHPSPRNLVLNNKKLLSKNLKKCKEWLKTHE